MNVETGEKRWPKQGRGSKTELSQLQVIGEVNRSGPQEGA